MEPPKQPEKVSLHRKSKPETVSSTDMETLMHVISHDLRAPIVTIQGFCQELTMACNRLNELFEEEVLSDRVRAHLNPLVTQDIPEAVRFIRAGAENVSSVTSGILRFIRLGQMAIQWEGLDVNRLVMGIVTSMEFQLKKNGVVLHIGDLPDCMGDEVLVTQVFANLIDNAQKYLDPARPGEITISGETVNGWSVYAVADTGIGIPAEHYAHIFQVFHRLNPKQEGGQGLGLAIVRRIIDRHQGKIEVESTPGKGATFRVYLPRAVVVEEGEHNES
ncbi:MAG: HAMP domain-containing histidine kinase [Nitrospirota bacterium]|nr:HAMP domain-containing histidine kinase [Nitrospirota bacterium]MDH4360654.1 HAMP domain-containing histidine kinase [Nitrospirota bacterium]MDH5297036.1 HAMP domain-containing histidine kinase [Nitrospirota bacterium]MDH5574708.1 HAMP domain-containing histidine kinase [Nitrospirota bacterium]